MGKPIPQVGSFLSKFLLAVVPGVVASVAGAYILNAIHLDRTSLSPEQLSLAAPQNDDLTAEERRELTRQMLKARRENREAPALVRPTQNTRAAAAVDGTESKSASDPARVATTPAPTVTASIPPGPRPSPATRARPDTAPPAVAAPATVAPAVASPTVAAVPPVSAPVAGGAPNQLAPVTVNASPSMGVALDSDNGANDPPPRRSFAANVFSSISVFAGTAANATGNTVNWVIQLPGKAISAGGKILGGDSASSNPSPPTPGPAPKGNVL